MLFKKIIGGPCLSEQILFEKCEKVESDYVYALLSKVG